ncbi:hypothetical protein [uncultured Imperialibacter sp.]|uniref:hypothetical protein n=1 Tax=uncultured Imperialibacter sp. TaxID=1672639 RepID=UPI0030DDAF29|tara:strand:+ start:389 stop:886 length:498 start_codon:yes stop_codon:yes gene_type:complete
MANKSDAELVKVINSPATYAEEAQLAAAFELKSRGTTSDAVDRLIAKLTDKLEAEQQVKEFEKKLTSKNTIYFLAFLVTPLVIGPFMAFNIWELGNRKGIWTVLGLTVLYLPLLVIALELLPSDLSWMVGVIHLIYGVFFVEWTWKKYLPTFDEYQKEKGISTQT